MSPTNASIVSAHQSKKEVKGDVKNSAKLGWEREFMLFWERPLRISP